MEQTSVSDIRQFLHACEQGDINWVDRALSAGYVQVDDFDDQGITALQMAAANGHEDLVRLLIMRGAALEKSSNFGWTPLLHAARQGHTSVVALLLQNNADINRKSRMGANALTCAVRGAHTKTASFLLDKGIEFDTFASPCELSAMFVASLLGHDSLLRLLVTRGWDINQRMQSTYMTPLMCAAINGHMTTSQILIERGCDPNITDINDKTALQLASDRGKREVVGFLDRKTSTNLPTVEEEDNKLDIIEATKAGNLERIRELVMSDRSQLDYCLQQDGATALMYAAMSGRFDILSFLVESGCDLNKQDRISGWTALMQAIFHGKKQLAKFLITSGADVTISAKNGLTAFDMASFIDDIDTELIRLLASKAMNTKTNSSKSSNGTELIGNKQKKKWWSKFSSHFKNLTKTFSKTKHMQTHTSSTMSRINSTSTINLDRGAYEESSGQTDTSSSFMDKKKSASLLHLNGYAMTTAPLNFQSVGAVGGSTLKPVIPPFLPQPSFGRAADTWRSPNQKSHSTLDLTGNIKHPMVRPTNIRMPTKTGENAAGHLNSPSPNSSGGASSISAMFSAQTSVSSATSSTLTPNNVDRFHRRAPEFDYPSVVKPPSFLLNTNRFPSLPRLYTTTGISPTNSTNSTGASGKRPNRLALKSRNSTSPNLASSRIKSLSDSGTSTGNSDILSLSASSQSVIHESEGEHEGEPSTDLGSILKNLSLEKYQPIFEKEEIDMEAFLMLNETDLCELGIASEDSRRQILSAITDLSSAKNVQRHVDALSDSVETSIRVRNSVHSDSTDLDEWSLHEEPKKSKKPASKPDPS